MNSKYKKLIMLAAAMLMVCGIQSNCLAAEGRYQAMDSDRVLDTVDGIIYALVGETKTTNAYILQIDIKSGNIKRYATDTKYLEASE